MPLIKRFLTTLAAAFDQRFAGATARFNLAVAVGFVIATVGFTTIVLDDRSGVADDMWGSMNFFGLGAPEQPSGSTAAPEQPSGWFGQRRLARRRVAHRTLGKVEPARFIRSVERVRTTRVAGSPMDLGRQSVCVRLCDGFAFPIGTYHGEQDRAAHEATCQSECPGAATALYVQPAGSEAMDEAVRVGSSKSYSELPYAFHYTTVLSDACSCHPPEGGRVASLLHDFTLRRGDAVMTASGFKVFHGASRFPYKRADFVVLARSSDIRKADRETFHAIERASLKGTPDVIAVRAAPAAKPTLQSKTLAPLTREASLVPPASPQQP